MTARTLRLLCVAALLPCFAAPLAAQALERAGDPDLQMVLVPTSAAYKLGQPIIVNIVYSNPSDQDIHYPFIRSDQGDLYKISVIQKSTGARLERTEIGKEAYYEVFGGAPPPPRKPLILAVGGGGWVVLPPHKSATVTTDLARTFKFLEPGKYRVEVIREPSTQPPVAPITITVVP